MKKALIVLLALGMIAGGLFAQDVSFSGGVTTGLFIKFGDSHDEVVVLADDDDVGVPVAGRFNVSANAGTWGLQLGTGADYKAGDLNMFMYNAHGWIGFAGGLVTARAGKIDPGVWTVGKYIDQNVSSGLGVRLEVTPMPGLNLGVFFNYPEGADKAYDKAGKIANFFQETAFGFSFAGDAFSVSAAAKLYSEETPSYGGADMDMKAIAGFGTSVAGINLYLGLDFDNLISNVDTGIRAALNVDTKFDALGVGLELALEMLDGLQLVHILPSVDYKLNDTVSFGLGVDVDLKGADMDLAWAIDPWIKYELGKAWLKGGFGVAGGAATDMYIKAIFGFSF